MPQKFYPEQSRRTGFTLIELLIVVTIIAILAAIGLTVYSTVLKNARDAKRQSDLKLIQSALEQYHADQKYYPYSGSVTSGTQLTNATGAPANTIVSKVYLNSIPQDPLRSPYPQYAYSATPSSCENSSTECTAYCLFAKVENSTNRNDLTTCSNGTYDHEVTSP